MTENFNFELSNLIRATSESPTWHIAFAKFIARYLISVVPVLLIVLWLYVPRGQIFSQRRLIIKIIIALAISILFSWILGRIFPHDRPFVDKTHHNFDKFNFLHHSSNNSFPSNHGSVIFTFALSFLFWHRLWSGIILLNIAVVIAWSRIYLGVHWPLDMLGSLVVGFISCFSAQITWLFYGLMFYREFKKVHRFFYTFPTRKDDMYNS